MGALTGEVQCVSVGNSRNVSIVCYSDKFRGKVEGFTEPSAESDHLIEWLL